MDLLADYPVLRNRMIAAHWMAIVAGRFGLTMADKCICPPGITAALDRLMQLEKDRRILAD